MSEEQEVTINKTARFYQSGPSDFKYKRVCFALHGYGQLAKFFIKPFEQADLEDTLIIAPEGMHRFYLDGNKGRVGASWMTKEDRLTDIADYVAFLDQLYAQFKELIVEAEEVGVLGFSQGVATACRWTAQSEFKFNYLINYAGAFPPDLDHARALPRVENMKLIMAVGEEDEFISEERFRQHLAEVESIGYHPGSFTFKGRHKVYPQVLKDLFSRL